MIFEHSYFMSYHCTKYHRGTVLMGVSNIESPHIPGTSVQRTDELQVCRVLV